MKRKRRRPGEEIKQRGRIKISSAKGKARTVQNWVAEQISKLIGLPWGKDQPVEPRGMGQPGVDVRLDSEARKLFPWAIECKWTESWDLPAAIRQIQANQKGPYEQSNWLVVLRKNYHPYIVVLDAEVFFKLLEGKKND